MPTINLTKSIIDNIPAGSRDVVYWDQLLTGFGLKVTPKGRKVFLVLYRTKDGLNKLRKYTIGTYGRTTPMLARKTAQRVLAACLEGKDPALEKQSRRKANSQDTFETIATEYIKRKVSHCRSSKETARIIERELVSQWKERPIHNLNKLEIVKVLDAIVDRGSPAMANQTFVVARALFNWCVGRGILDRSPCIGLSKPSREIPRNRTLTDDELFRVISSARHIGYPYGSIIEVLAYTGQRRHEVADAKWNEFDLEQQTWIIPAERAKNGKAHLVHLAPGIVSMLERIEIMGEHVFVAESGASFSDFSDCKRDLDFQANVRNWVVHDLRRTAVTGMARLGVQPHVADKILNHQTGAISGIAAVYQRFEFLDERKHALNGWAKYLDGLVDPKVVALDVA